MQHESFDYIILGAGAAGLMLATAMGEDPHFQDRSILLLEKQQQRSNDRTWSYWEKGSGRYDHLLIKKWNTIRFKDEISELDREIKPYAYKTLRALDFYSHHESALARCANVVRKQDIVHSIEENDKEVIVRAEKNVYKAQHVFSSIHAGHHWKQQKEYPVLQQHFLGWYINSEQAIFNSEVATFMDFSIAQNGNTRFMYVLPTSSYSGLVEYTLFSKFLLQDEDYENALKQYIKDDLNCKAYTIIEKEKGSIPMTAYDFSRHNTPRITYIGTAGGWTKPSTGFTFKNTQKNTEKLLENIKNNSKPIGIKQARRHRIYDILLLDILSVKNEIGANIFAAMFRKRKAQSILAFLDEETTFFQELNMIWACPKMPFLKALWKRIF